jgi:hypothetical protein
VTTHDTELIVLQHDPAWSCAAWQDVLLLVWRGEATAARAAINVRFLQEFSASHPGGFGIMLVLEPETSPPDDKARQMLADGMRRLGPGMRGAAYLVPMQGFKGSLMRSVITGLSLIARETYPTQAFPRLPEATRWLCARMSQTATPPVAARLEAVVEQLRTRA